MYAASMVCSAVYLNWRYADGVDSAGKVLGQSTLVNAGEQTEVPAGDYFATARLTRQQARDSAIALLEQAAAKAGIVCQREILLAGGTDTSSIQMAGNGAIATCVSVPTRHIHSPAETFNRSDVEQAGKLLCAVLAEAL